MKNLAFIPARAGSKRLPGKNTMDFCGKPLLYYTVDVALKSNLFDSIVVSTDDDESKALALEYGVQILERPDDLAGDHVETSEVAQRVLQEYIRTGSEFTSFTTLQVTNPLRTVKMLQDAMRIFNERDVDSVISVSENKHKLGKIQEGRFIPTTYSPGQRSQDLDSLYFENGLFYISKPEIILHSDIFGKNIWPVVIEGVFGEVDIDTEVDFKKAEYLFKAYTHLFDF